MGTPTDDKFIMIHDSVIFRYCGRSCFCQKSAEKDSERPDSSASSLSGRTDNKQFFFLKSGQRTESTEAESGQNPDSGQTPDRIYWKILVRIKTRQGQRCPPMSGFSYPCLPGSTKLETDSSLFCNWGWAYRR